MLDKELVVEHAPPQDDRLPDQLFVHLIPYALDGDLGIGPDVTALGLPGKGAEPLPGTHLADSGGGEVGEPILESGMRFRAVGLLIVPEQEVHSQA